MNLKELNPKKILIINTFGIGDVLFSTPFVSNLRAHFPNSFIGYIANIRSAPILKDNKKIDKVFVYERDDFLAVYKKSKLGFILEVGKFLNEVKKEDFDVVFDFSLNSSANFLMWWIGIKHRIGFNYKNRSPFLTYKVPFTGFEDKHVADYYLDLLTELGIKVLPAGLEVFVPEEDHFWVDQFLKQNGISSEQRIVGVIPGGGASWGKEARFRRWDPEKFVKLVDKIIEKSDQPIILMGDKFEESICDSILKGVKRGKIIKACGKTTLTQFIALLKRCQCVVVNDGGPLHLAVAAGTRTLSLFGPVDENVYGPYGSEDQHRVVKSDVLCRPCYRKFKMTNCEHISCMKNIEVEDILPKLEGLL